MLKIVHVLPFFCVLLCIWWSWTNHYPLFFSKPIIAALQTETENKRDGIVRPCQHESFLPLVVFILLLLTSFFIYLHLSLSNIIFSSLLHCATWVYAFFQIAVLLCLCFYACNGVWQWLKISFHYLFCHYCSFCFHDFILFYVACVYSQQTCNHEISDYGHTCIHGRLGCSVTSLFYIFYSRKLIKKGLFLSTCNLVALKSMICYNVLNKKRWSW